MQNKTGLHQKLVDKYFKLDIRAKINTIYLVIFVLSLSFSYFLYNTLTVKVVENEISSNSMQTLHAIDKNVEFILEDVEHFSNLIFFDRTVQEALRSISSDNVDVDVQLVFNKYLSSMITSGNYISSVYLFDNYSNRYAMGKTLLKALSAKRIEDLPIYKKIAALEGGGMWFVNSGGILLGGTPENYISLARIVNDINTMDKLATLVVNVNESTIQTEFEDVGKKYNSQFFIIDSNGKYVVRPGSEDNPFEEELTPLLKQEQGYIIKKLGDNKVIVSFISSKYADWKIVGIIPIHELYKGINVMSYVIIAIVLINFILFSISALYISRLITQPLIRMQHYMKKAEQGNFITMPAEAERREDEIVQLKRVYNRMVVEIEKLIIKVKEEERIIRKNELNLIQAQISPHFLYNTLDAISALSLIGDSKNAYTLTQSLGSFYRTSLSSGKETITVAEEISCIKSYLAILDIRYNGKYQVTYDIADEILGYKILKLVLQPIVENAVHHGLRSKKGRGSLQIHGSKQGELLVFKVQDDGVGMTAERIKEVLSSRTTANKSGFGLYSAKQRLSIFYNISDPMEIRSGTGEGTVVTIRIPAVEEENHEG